MLRDALPKSIGRIKQILKYLNVDVQELIEDNARMKEILERRSILEEIGVLAASIEHDIKNPLGVMELDLAMMRRRFQWNHEIMVGLERIEEQRRRIFAATKIIPLLRGEAHFYKKLRSNVDIRGLINRCIKAIKDERSSPNVFFKFDGQDRSAQVYAYVPMLQQAIINILKNSIEAINKTNRRSGLINITLAKDSDRLRISIRDNGCGIPEEDIPKLTTLYTTKRDDKPNAGIGLYITGKIIDFHNGKLDIKSKIGEGTVVSIFIPRHDLRKAESRKGDSE